MSKIKKSKNVISDSNISAGGNVHIGDVTNVYHNSPTEKEGGQSTEKGTIAKEARKLIAANKIKEAINYLEKETVSLKDSIPKQIAQQSAKWNKFKEEDRMNLLLSLIHISEPTRPY